ncbi:MAG TPA: amidohydrolase family protein [Novosphingobium sp.]
MLIRNAEVWGHGLADVRLSGDIIAEIAPPDTLTDGYVIDAHGGALLPGLHDHHIHLAAQAARAASVFCGPPEVNSPEELATVLKRAGTGWLRGTGYHESVMGLPNARSLDRLLPDRPLRIQHRSGRMWLLNSPALALLLDAAAPPSGLERDANGYTGRLFDEDAWLQAALSSEPPDFAAVSHELARFGVTGVTDMSPRNDAVMAAHVSEQIRSGRLRQHCRLAGSLELAKAANGPWQLGEAKLHLHEAALPDPDETARFVAAAHDQQRAVAIHCVSEIELVYALAILRQSGPRTGDRIEHASITTPDLIREIAAMGLHVCVQPHFLSERGDRYLLDVEQRHHADLYHLLSLQAAGIALAGGSDAPFGSTDPWQAMAAAVSRRTPSGQIIGAEEALTPEAALALYLVAPDAIGSQRRVEVNAQADLCLLAAPWAEIRRDLGARHVRATIASGHIICDPVDQSPG